MASLGPESNRPSGAVEFIDGENVGLKLSQLPDAWIMRMKAAMDAASEAAVYAANDSKTSFPDRQASGSEVMVVTFRGTKIVNWRAAKAAESGSEDPGGRMAA